MIQAKRAKRACVGGGITACGARDVVVGFGGYVAVSAYLAARRQGLPIVVHEANARPGVANRLAARMTTHVFTAGPNVRLAHATAIGIPLRPAITRLAGLDYSSRGRAAIPLIVICRCALARRVVAP